MSVSLYYSAKRERPISPEERAHVAEVLDRYTVQFVLSEPYTSFPINLLLTIVPNGAGTSLKDHPVGAGPYQFVSQVADDHVVLQAYPGYWQGAPSNSGLLLKVVPDEVMRALEVSHGTMIEGRVFTMPIFVNMM